jgi:DNA helicase II / ATP-dependent DNA helicase PcrA
MQIKFSALDIAEALELGYKPNEQQQAAIQAPYDKPSLVVAGAGSGKTDLMSLRVPWLVANRIATPDEVLGLTYTRKAAAQLANRINKNLRKLAKSKVLPGVWPDELGGEFTPPTVSTYNSYATSLFRDFGLQLGYDSDAVQLTDATAFQLARDLLKARGHEIDPRLLESDFNEKTLIKSVISLAAEMNEHVQTGAGVEKWLDRQISGLLQVPAKEGTDPDLDRNKYMIEIIQKLENKRIIATLAQAFIDEKKRVGRIDFSDQVALALEAVNLLDRQIQDREQARFTQVLLDEYQDTSVLQTKLLGTLFKGKSVMAVGDPHQSIYGWRGASASNLAEFNNDFGGTGAEPYQLSTSWRNPLPVLQVANEIARPLDTPGSYMSADQIALVKSVSRDDLEVRPGEAPGSVSFEWHETIELEAEGIADWFNARMTTPVEGKAPTGALLLAKKKHIPIYVKALQGAGIEAQVVGLGALLTMPEVTDVRAVLKIISRPDAGSELIRILTGARFNIGPKDIDELHKYSKSLLHGDWENRNAEGRLDEARASLVDALDRFYRRQVDGSPVPIEDMERVGTPLLSDAGKTRMHEAAKLFWALRKRIGLPLPELVRTIIAELWLDVELQANPKRANPMIYLNEFVALVTAYASNTEHATIEDLLEYLDFADDLERVDAAPPAARPGMVQIMTIHASKGLEWHHVAVGSFNDGDLPKDVRDGTGWINSQSLPYELRGDRKSLPAVDLPSYPTQTQLNKGKQLFQAQVGVMQQEEQRRLAYVAVTRPMIDLLVTGSYWQPGESKAKSRSPYLDEVAAAGVQPFASYEMPPLVSQENLADKQSLVEHWPKPAFTEQQRIQVIRSSTDFKNSKLKPSADTTDEELKSLIEQVDLLLLEDRDRKSSVMKVDFPVRIPASNFKAFLGELEFVAGSFLRPVPSEPYGASRRGNLFHAWVERSNSPIGLIDNDEDLPELEDEDDFIEVEQLQENFKNSRFAKMQPVALEQEVQLTIGSNTFICKMDAVYADGDGFEIVDWKTNTPPVAGSEDEAKRALQLSLYRFAYSEFTGVPLEKIKATFYFVGADEELSPAHLADRAEILAKWQEVLDKVAEGAAAGDAEASSKN